MSFRRNTSRIRAEDRSRIDQVHNNFSIFNLFRILYLNIRDLVGKNGHVQQALIGVFGFIKDIKSFFCQGARNKPKFDLKKSNNMRFWVKHK